VWQMFCVIAVWGSLKTGPFPRRLLRSLAGSPWGFSPHFSSRTQLACEKCQADLTMRYIIVHPLDESGGKTLKIHCTKLDK